MAVFSVGAFGGARDGEVWHSDDPDSDGDNDDVYELPKNAGFHPAPLEKGSGEGGKLRILCLPGAFSNRKIMENQMNLLVTSDPKMKNWVDLVFIDAPHSLSWDEMPLEDVATCKVFGGEPFVWHDWVKKGSLREEWPLLEESIQYITAMLTNTGPWDGICGYGQGGEVVSLIAKLAEEGEPELQGVFKFVLCISHVFPKQAAWLPVAPLKVPSCHIFETNGPCSLATYESTALHWEPAFREVIFHRQGPKMPKLHGKDLERLRNFLHAFYTGEAWTPAQPDPSGFGEISLPVARYISPRVACQPTCDRLLVVCFHDRQVGSSDPSIFNGLSDRVIKERVLYNHIVLDPPDLRRYGDFSRFCAESESSKDDKAEHTISEHFAKEIEQMVCRLLQTDIGRRPIFVVGIGVGAYIGLVFARTLRERGGRPRWLFAVRPTASFPLERTAVLGPCAVTCFLPELDDGGERWRYGIATQGPFTVDILSANDKHKWEDKVIRSLRAFLPPGEE